MTEILTFLALVVPPLAILTFFTWLMERAENNGLDQSSYARVLAMGPDEERAARRYVNALIEEDSLRHVA